MTDDVLVQTVCHEPNGDIERVVRRMEFTPQNIKTFWEKSKLHPTLFTEETRGDFRKFLSLIMKEYPDGTVEANGLFYVVDDFVGVFYLTNIKAQDKHLVDALVHYSFFDGRIRGRQQLAKEMIKFAFNRHHFQRLSAEIPLFVRPTTFKFVEDIGFLKEGRRRAAILYKGEWFDSNLYGILRNEVLNGSTRRSGANRAESSSSVLE